MNEAQPPVKCVCVPCKASFLGQIQRDYRRLECKDAWWEVIYFNNTPSWCCIWVTCVHTAGWLCPVVSLLFLSLVCCMKPLKNIHSRGTLNALFSFGKRCNKWGLERLINRKRTFKARLHFFSFSWDAFNPFTLCWCDFFHSLEISHKGNGTGWHFAKVSAKGKEFVKLVSNATFQEWQPAYWW